MRVTRWAMVGTLALAALLIVGAAALKLAGRGQPPATSGIARLIETDWVHVPAHLLLYGSLMACCLHALSGRRWLSVLVVAVVAVAQEASQTLLFGRAMGWPEAFDLAVDALAVAAVLRLAGGAYATIAVRLSAESTKREERVCRPPPPP